MCGEENVWWVEDHYQAVERLAGFGRMGTGSRRGEEVRTKFGVLAVLLYGCELRPGAREISQTMTIQIQSRFYQRTKYSIESH